MWIFEPYRRSNESEPLWAEPQSLHFKQDPQVFSCLLKFEKH